MLNALTTIRVCPCCGNLSNTVKVRHRHTAYCEAEDSLNYLDSCSDCIAADNEYYDDLWQELYADQLAGLNLSRL